MSEDSNPTKRVGWGWYAGSVLSFVPLLGFFWGLVCIVYGLVQRKRGGIAVAGIGLAGILFTFGLYGYIFWQLKHPSGGLVVAQTQLLKQHTLPDLIRRLEYYKLQNDHYPQRLEDLGPDVVGRLALQNNSLGKIYYALSSDGGTYDLFAVGPDGRPFTSDDILPDISSAEMAKTGFRVRASTR